MHESALNFATGALTADEVAGKRVIEAGSMNVNGTVRPHVESLDPASYTGIDMRAGDGVDLVMDAGQIPALLGYADVVISTEMLEHAEDWQDAVRGLIAAVIPGGVLVLTTRSAGFPLHGYPDDHWRFSVDAMGQIMKSAGLEILRLEPDGQAPGVFCKARKPEDWSWPGETAQVWSGVEVTRP